MASPTNTTSLTGPLSKDIVMAVPRMMARAGSFAFITVPERIDSMLGFRHGGSIIAEATGNGTWNMISAALSAVSTADAAIPTAARTAAATEGSARSLSSLSFMQVRNFGGIFTYLTSKWAVACFTLSIILNRTQVYSATRRHVTLSWPFRLALRIVPLLLFLSHTLSLLQALRCQTSPRFSSLKYGDADQHVDLDFAGEGGFLYYISSVLLFWENEGDSCLAIDLIPSGSEPWPRKGSLSLLWPFFQSLCLGQFIDTLSSTIQGRLAMTETGMSIFEHSLAFAEAEAMIRNRLGKFFASSELLEKLNTTPEVLLMAVLSSLNSITSQSLGVFNLQAKYRLINTGFWGLCFMSSFIWAIFRSVGLEAGIDAVVLRFPTVCIVGFIPHLLILAGVFVCSCIYILALALCFLSPPSDGPQPQSFAGRFQLARENMQANGHLSNFHIDMHEDFYTALLKIGFTALTVASEAVYLNEGERVKVLPLTWLEEERMEDMEKHQVNPLHQLGVSGKENATGELLISRSAKNWKSGYGREIKPKSRGRGTPYPRTGNDGVGHVQRYGRYFGVGAFFHSIWWLYVSWVRLCTNKILDRFGIAWRPQWLRLQKRQEETQEGRQGREQTPSQALQPFWILSDKGLLELPKSEDFDAAKEIERRLRSETEKWGEEEEEDLDTRCYNWFKSGEWGEKDGSASYQASIADDDTTSVISMSTTTSESEWEDTGSGASTPTQSHPYYINRSGSPTPEPKSFDYARIPLDPHPLDPHHLASLLDPKTPEARSEARMYAKHLTSSKITTRSRYLQSQNLANTKLLTTTRYRPPNSNIPSTGPLSPEEEGQLLEQLLSARRSQPLDQRGRSWREGAAGMGQGGPQCVVCQSAPRTIMAFPCRCLSLCEECRVSLAMNNFATCVCCRQEVASFSRLFVP